MFFKNNAFVLHYANDTDAYNPEMWANESLAVLEENMVAGQLIHRDFEDEIADFGDVVNTRKPASFTGKRKGVSDDVTIQDASSTNVAVKLNQLLHVSFLIRDGEASKSFKDLVAEYLVPAVIAQASFVDKVVLGQYPQFIDSGHGSLGGLSTTNGLSYILGSREKLNINKAPTDSRHMIWGPSAETNLLNLDLFTHADKVGDDGTALREASIGRKLGANHWMAQNMASFTGAADTVAGAINNVAGYNAGDTVFTVDGFAAAIGNNSWITVAGDDTPLRVVSTVGGATPTQITVASPGLLTAVVNDAVVTTYYSATGKVNLAAGYAIDYDDTIIYDGFTNLPQVGQLVTFGTSPTSPVYTIIETDATTILLDRPLEAALADDDEINLGPTGGYNLSLHRNALGLIVRPLAPPPEGTGARSAVVSHNGLSMRSTLTYEGTKHGLLVTIDMLFGIKVLDALLGSVIYT